MDGAAGVRSQMKWHCLLLEIRFGGPKGFTFWFCFRPALTLKKICLSLLTHEMLQEQQEDKCDFFQRENKPSHVSNFSRYKGKLERNR